MKFKHNRKLGKHPYIKNKIFIFDKVLTACKSIDNQSRLISTQFGRVKTPKPSYKLKINSHNPFEVFIQITHNKWFQRLKVECSSDKNALILEKRLTVILSEEFSRII